MTDLALDIPTVGLLGNRWRIALGIAVGFGAPVASFVTFGVTMTLGVLAAPVFAIIIALYPTIGLVALVICGTSLQVLGSDHIPGLPMSLGKLFGLVTVVAFAVWTIRTRFRLTYAPAM